MKTRNHPPNGFQQLCTLERKQFDRFVEALDRPPREHSQLRALLSIEAPWEELNSSRIH
jgi:uncharacterized protein (DUF1778 family)